jgi:hypothetical protein
VTANEHDRFFPVQDIDRFTLLQIAKQPEIPLQNMVRRRIPTSVNNEDLKPWASGIRSRRLPGADGWLDDRGFFSPRGFF